MHILNPFDVDRVKAIIVLILSTFILFSCDDSHTSDTGRLLDEIESYMDDRPDSALVALEGIEKVGLDSRELKARHALLKWFLMLKTTGEIPEYEILKTAYDHYTIKKPSCERFLSHLYKGIYFIKHSDYENAMEEFIKAEDDYEYAQAKHQALLHSYKGYIHKRYYDYPSAISEVLLSAEKFREANSMRQFFYAIAEIVDCHIMNDDLEAASEYLDIAEKNLEYGNARDIHDYYLIKAKVISRKYGHQACADMLDGYLDDVKDESNVISWRFIAYMYNNAGRYGKALECIEKEALYNDISNDQNYYFVLAEVKSSLKDYKGAVEAYKRAMDIDGSTETGKRITDVKYIEERHRNEVNQLKAKNQKNSIILISLVALLASIIIILQIRKRLQQRTEEKKQLEIEKQRYESMYSEVVTERDELTRMIEDNTMNEDTKNIIEKRLGLLNKVIVSYITDTSAANRKANEELEALVSDRDTFITQTRMTLESSHPAFFRYLYDKGLTDWEINYCCLYLIGLKGKDIGEYINLKRHYTYGSVIRQKLGLTENDTNLSLYLRKLMDNLQA